MEPGLGLRERKKAATRRALHEAAVALTLEHGLDRVTVEAIADAASVSRRTFSNYFGGKEQALLYDDRCQMDRLVRLAHDRPESDTAWQALTAAALELCADLGDVERLHRMRALRRHPSLLSEQIALFASAETDLAATVDPRLPAPDPLRARVIAAAFLTALRVATHRWLEHTDTPLTDEVSLVMGAMAEPFD